MTCFLAMVPGKARSSMGGRWPKVACLGNITAQTARGEGLPVTAQPARQELDGLVEAIVEAVGRG